MISFFRRALNSPLVLGLLALIALAFVITGIGTPAGLGALSGGGGSLASVGGKGIGEAEATRRIQTQLEGARRDRPGLDMPKFVAAGGVEQSIEQMINGLAIERFARKLGLVVSRRQVDGEIASIPAFNGPAGKFDRATFLSVLAQRKIPEPLLRADFEREALTKALLVPATGAAQVPLALASPYAKLLLESREGQLAVVPATAMTGVAPPTEQDISSYYATHVSRYTLPERRVIRYALFDKAKVAGNVAPTEAEIASAYNAKRDVYAGGEKRVLTQVILPSAADAEALGAKVRGGMPMEAAARSVGLEALKLAPTDRASFERTTNAAVAAAAFGAARGAVAAVARSGLGYHLIRVDEIQAIAGRPLAAVRGEIVSELTATKTQEAMSDLVGKMEDDINGGADFDGTVAKYGLTASTTPPVTGGGMSPGQPAYRAPPALANLLHDSFQADPADDPAVSTLGADAGFALFHVDRVLAAAPQPLAAVRAQVAQEAALDKASQAARVVAVRIQNAADRGTPLSRAVADAGVRLPAPQPIGARRLDLARNSERVPPPLALLFTMSDKHAKLLEMPQSQGWFVIYLDKIIQGDPAQAAPLIEATRGQLSRIAGDEYAAQFVAAIKKSVGVTRNAGAIAALKRSLAGGAQGQ